MTCVDKTCGTGGWDGPKPGDPSNDINLTAIPAYGGIDLNWSFPTTNPFALSYVVVFRGITNDFNGAFPIGQDTDGFYHDKVAPDRKYYYWIQAVSINGTFGPLLGPASATAMASIAQTMIDLTAKIDEGLLAKTLREKIESITQNNAAIMKEIQDRIAANTALQTALASVSSTTDTAMTYILNEIKARTDADSALVNQVNAIATGLNENKAAITNEATVRATKHDALATTVSTLFAAGGAGDAALIAERKVWAAADKVIADDYTALAGRVKNTETGLSSASGAITDIKNLTIEPTSALATKLSTLQADASGAKTAVNDLSTSLADGTHALAQRLTTVETEVDKDIAAVQQGLTTKIDNVTKAIDAMYFVKVNVNDLVGGFGIWNNGKEVQAGFDVNTFWVGTTQANKMKPFIISNGVTYISEAAIEKLTFTKLRDAAGSVIIENGKLKAAYIDVDNLTAKKIDLSSGGGGTARTTMTNGLIQVFHPNGNLAVRLGIW